MIEPEELEALLHYAKTLGNAILENQEEINRLRREVEALSFRIRSVETTSLPYSTSRKYFK
jgi:hypothetical protein